jgi:hypothetical protein
MPAHEQTVRDVEAERVLPYCHIGRAVLEEGQ